MAKAFVIEQKITLMANQYRIFAADNDSNKQQQIGFVHQKRLAFRERFDFYTDESRNEVLFSVKARNVIDVGARYDISDNQGRLLGIIGKNFKASLIRSTWNIFHPGEESQPVAVAQERSMGLAIARRLWEFLPYIGDIPFFVRYHFDFKKPGADTVLATYEKTTTFRDHYLLTIGDELEKEIDWRTLVALGVMMDALQSR
jgi:uncharacterized protein YxjI